MSAASSRSSFAIAAALAAAACSGSGRPGTEAPPPSVVFSQPPDGTVMRGLVLVRAVATGQAARIKALRFTQPAGLEPVEAAFDDATRSATLEVELDLSRYPDGELPIAAEATDANGRTTTRSVTIRVANGAPDVSVGHADGEVATGVVALSASARAEGDGRLIRSLGMVEPPPGVGADRAAAADRFEADWDTTLSKEGRNLLLFRAEDTTGAAADRAVAIVVDNVPFGVIDVYLRPGGSPIAGAHVEVYAVDDATAEVDTSVGMGGLLGSGTTDETGYAMVVLPVENYRGPIQVQAMGLDSAPPSYVDAEGRAMTVPNTFRFTSYVGLYATGSQLVVPLSFTTTLADAAAYAYAKGLHPDHPGPRALATALAERDPLFEAHVHPAAGAWSLRRSVPPSLAAAQALGPSLPSLWDAALAPLAREIGRLAGFAPGAAVVNVFTLAELLVADALADGRFDGAGEGGAPIATGGASSFALDSNTLRARLATALDTFVSSPWNGSGITGADLAAAGVYAAMASDLSDLFGDEPPLAFQPADRTPPVVAFDPEPPVATNYADLLVSLSVNDEVTGAAKVWVRVGTDSPILANPSGGGTWTAVLHFKSEQAHTVTVWAEDLAGNSGEAYGEPHRISRTVILDRSAPAAALQSVASYRDERGMTTSAAVPATYGYAGGKVPLLDGSHVYKASTRLGFAGPPSALELETTNAGNVPFLKFLVPYSAASDAPVVGASYTVSCAGCPGSTPAVGPLWPAASSPPGSLAYLLPLATDLFPSLATPRGPATVTISLSLLDAAGNASFTTPVTLTWHVIGAPLVFFEDAWYPNAGDQRSTFGYARAAGNYASLSDPNAFPFSLDGVRLARFVAANPAPVPVVLDPPSIPNGWLLREEWAGGGLSLGSRIHADRATSCFPSALPRPCGPDQTAVYAGGEGLGALQCDPALHAQPPDEAVVAAIAALGSAAYRQVAGADAGAAERTADGRFVVPAATASGPGVLSVYLVRPRTGRSYPLGPFASGTHQHVVEDAWRQVRQTANRCNDVPVTTHEWAGTRWVRTLTAARDVLGGSFAVTTRPLWDGAAVGEPTAVSTVDVTRQIAH